MSFTPNCQGHDRDVTVATQIGDVTGVIGDVTGVTKIGDVTDVNQIGDVTDVTQIGDAAETARPRVVARDDTGM